MKYGSVCSGIEAASVAWEPLGWEASFLSEIDKFPSAVLAHHFPNVPNAGDFTNIQKGQYDEIDLLVGGTPCQDFSVAGKRAGFEGLRGGLTFAFVDLVRRLMPRWLVWENVPGVLSGDCRRGFFRFMRELSDIGYSCCWRVLDAQYVRVDGYERAVPQRRRRVFLVGYFGDWRPPAAVLFEPESLRGNAPPERRHKGQATGSINESIGVRGNKKIACVASTASNAEYTINLSPTITCSHDGSPIVFGIPGNWIGRSEGNGSNQVQPNDNHAPCLTKTDRHAVATENEIRRLTPMECERLQGFPDNWTKIPWRGKDAEDCPDGPRYKALGNSMAVNCMRWIGKRIQMVEEL